MTDALSTDLEARILRIEAIQEISQLPSRYAMALDARDIDGLVELFVDDVRVTRELSGRAALRAFYDQALRTFESSIHLVSGNTVDLIDADCATGVTYCRGEHQDGDGWYVMAMRYDNRYERRDGHWLFSGRREQHWYATDVLERPRPRTAQWPSHGDLRPTLPDAFDTWAPFWNDEPH